MTTPSPAPVPVTLNCSGGIALGAYMAGVFTDLVTASLTPRPQGGTALRIDSITGASAGAMTGLIAVRYLLQEPQRSLAELADDGPTAPRSGRSLQADPANGFYRAWVRNADIRVLTDYGPEPLPDQARPRLGLLSGERIGAIAADVAGHWTAADLPGMRQALAERSLALLMTVTNLQGVLRCKQPDQLSVSHAETRRFLFHRTMPGLQGGGTGAEPTELQERWSKAKASAQASGAFPLAFPPLSDTSNPRSINLALDPHPEHLYRQAAERNGEAEGDDPDRVAYFEDPGDPTTLRLRFDYTDGGVLDGLPILKGIALLNQLEPDRIHQADADLQTFAGDWGHPQPDEQRRRFVYVQPLPVTELTGSGSLLKVFFGALASALAGLTYPKAEHDHLRLEQIGQINDLVRHHPELPYRHVALAPIHPVLPFSAPPAGAPAFRQLLLEVTQQVTGQRHPVAETAPDGDWLQAFETLLGKRDRRDRPLSDQVSPGRLLASDLLGAFGGFFQERYRSHDYLIGRLSGLAWLWQEGLVDGEVLRPVLRSLVERARTDYLPEHQRTQLRVPQDWLRLLRLLVVRLPYVLLSDLLADRRPAPAPLPAWQRRLLRHLVAPLLGLLLLLLTPVLALASALVWIFGAWVGL